MGEKKPLSRVFLEELGIDPKTLSIGPFKPTCWYNESLDWFFYLSSDCSYVATRTEDPHIELLKDKGETVGMKVMWFSDLPPYLRDKFRQVTGIDPDDILGIKDIMLDNAGETTPGIEVAKSPFFKELRWRENHFRHEALYDSGFPTIRGRHGRVMIHFLSLDPNRLPG